MPIISYQSKNLKKNILNIDSANDFLAILQSPDIEQLIAQYSHNSRPRIFDTDVTLAMFLKQVMSDDRSCAKAVNDYIIQNNATNVSANTSAFCQARQRLPIDLIQDLSRFIGKKVIESLPKNWAYNDRKTFVVDGSTSTMPDTENSQKKYPQQSAQKPGLGFPICRTLTVNCLTTGIIKDFVIGKFKGKGADEQTMLRSVLDNFEQGDLVLGDAFYGTYFLLSEMINRKVDVLFEQHGTRKMTTDFKKGKRLGERDHIIEIPKPKNKPDWMTQEYYDNSPNSIKIREVKVAHKLLITTILDPKEESKNSLGILYKKRWNVEVDYRNLKTTLSMDILSCKTADMCEKEIWMHVLAHNIIRLLSAQSAYLFGLTPREISFKHCLQVWLTYCLLSRT